MSSEYCPRCRAPRNVCVDVTRRTVDAPGGTRNVRTRTIQCRTIQCATCRHFIRSEDVGEAPASAA